MKKIFASLIFLFCTISHAQNIETLWIARGIEGAKRLEELNQKTDLSAQQKCELDLEFAFSLFSNPKTAALAIKKLEGGKKTFNLYIRSPSGKALNLAFGYTGATKTPDVILPNYREGASDEWIVPILPNSRPGFFGAQNSKCAFKFSPEDYLHPEPMSF